MLNRSGRLVTSLLLAALFLSGCAGLPFNLGNAPASTATEVLPPSPTPNETAIATTPDAGNESQPLTLQVWLPPQFSTATDDPATATAAGAILQARLDDFAERHPGVRVVVRVKAESGTGGLYDSLANADAAAPLALPDLIALPDELMRQAANRGLIEPLAPYLTEAQAEDWYPFAEQMALANGVRYALPFSADLLVLAYRPSLVETPPASWEDALNSGHTLAFPAANPGAVFTLAMYQSLNGSLQNEAGEHLFEIAPLTELLSFYAQAANRDLMPFWLTQYDTNALAFQALRENSAQMSSAWYSAVLASEMEDVAIASLPTQSGATFNYAQGYVWALSSGDPQRYTVSVELAEWLSDPAFLAEWLSATHTLPTRPSSLDNWALPAEQLSIGPLLPEAVLLPDELTRTTLGAPLHEAVIAVLKLEQSPQAAAQQVIDALSP